MAWRPQCPTSASAHRPVPVGHAGTIESPDPDVDHGIDSEPCPWLQGHPAEQVRSPLDDQVVPPTRPQAHRRTERQRDRADERSPRPDGALVKALARAWRWRRLLDEGQFASVRELAEAERIGLSYISRVLRLTLLAPDITERDPGWQADCGFRSAHEAVPGRVGAAARGAAGDPTARGPSNIWFIGMRMRRSVVYCCIRRCFIRFMDRWTVRAEVHAGSAIGRQTRCITPGSRAGEPGAL